LEIQIEKIMTFPRIFLMIERQKAMTSSALVYSCCCEVKNPDVFDVAGKI